MIIVSGTKRSGTSMWMQVLGAAGLPRIGEAFPRNWDKGLRDANPQGFWESSLRRGVNFETNPDPKTGVYLHPADTRGHVTKVFLSALPRTDHAFLDRAIITVRDWRTYTDSVTRLDALQGKGEPTAEARYDAAIEWYLEVFHGLRDVLLRRYPCHVLSYESVLANPRAIIGETLRWLELPHDLDAALTAINPDLQRSARPSGVPGLDPASTEVFDELYDRIHTGRALTEGFVARLNRTWERLRPVAEELLRRHALRPNRA